MTETIDALQEVLDQHARHPATFPDEAEAIIKAMGERGYVFVPSGDPINAGLLGPTVTIYPQQVAQKWVVHCRACGGNIQATGVGGFNEPEPARTVAHEHRMAHLAALQREIAVTQEAP